MVRYIFVLPIIIYEYDFKRKTTNDSDCKLCTKKIINTPNERLCMDIKRSTI